MFRALLALGLTSHAYALPCGGGGRGTKIDSLFDPGHVFPGDESILEVRGYANSYKGIGMPEEDCPTGWAHDGSDCILNVPAGLEESPVTDCQVNMCPDGYGPVEGTCTCTSVSIGDACVECSDITSAEDYINGQCCEC